MWDYEQWEGVEEVSSWNPPHLEHVRGSDAFQFPPGLALGDRLRVWVGELYRAAALVAREQVGWQGG